MMLISSCSLLAFSLNPHVDGAARIGYLITLLLTAVAYQFAIVAELPKVAYLTFMDSYILKTFLIIFGMLIETAMAHRVSWTNFDRWCLYFFLMTYMLIQAGFIYFGHRARQYELLKLTQSPSEVNNYVQTKKKSNTHFSVHKHSKKEETLQDLGFENDD